MTEETTRADVYVPGECLLVTASWAPSSQSCLEVFRNVATQFDNHKIKFIERDYDNDFSLSQLEALQIKAAPLWRFSRADKVEFEQYGGQLTIAQLKALIHSYLL